MSYETRLRTVQELVEHYLSLHAEINPSDLAEQMLHALDTIPEKIR